VAPAITQRARASPSCTIATAITPLIMFRSESG
jgi:hypothetical protein